MSINMQGSWTVAVKSKSAAYQQRFVIAGAAAGNGTYAGVTTTPSVFVSGAHWTITIQANPGTGWVDSADQITFPAVSGYQVKFDIQSNDKGPDQDFNDLILTCSTPQTSSDFFVYGHVSYYSGICISNPCWPGWLVIDTPAALASALKNPNLKAVIAKLYPDRLKVRPPQPPGPSPDPPFRPLVVPLRDAAVIPARQVEIFGLAKTENLKAAPEAREASLAAVTSIRTVALPATTAAMADFNRVAVAGIIDHMIPYCETGALPGVALKFLEYDRTSSELSGGPYTGSGNRENLGICATDRNGNYIFRFSRTPAQFASEVSVDVAPGEDPMVQVLPDVIVELLDPVQPAGYCYESAPYWNIPSLKRINICVPKDCIGRLPTACQGGRAIQALGDILVVDPNNIFDNFGRITAKSSLPNTPPARCAAWAGSIDFFACFLDQPKAVYYTIRTKRPTDLNWSFFLEKYTHLKIANLGVPGYTGDLVGPDPAIPALHIDGGSAVKVPAYNNIENDPAWVFTHRDRKAVISSWLYGTPPGTVLFKIEAYDSAGNKLTGAQDTITLYIDNYDPAYDIASVSMLGQSGGDCALFTVPLGQPAAPLTVTFRANQTEGFLYAYGLAVRKGNIGGFAVTGAGPGQISGSYTHTSDNPCNQFEGTFDDPTHDAAGYVVSDLTPTSGQWLEAAQSFCTFAVQLSCSVRRTNGYNYAVYSFGPTEYLLGIQK
jgi:hypothetical protein